MFLVSNEIMLWLRDYMSRATETTEPVRASATVTTPVTGTCRPLKWRARRMVTDGHGARVAPAGCPTHSPSSACLGGGGVTFERTDR